ncbi:MAG TPA: type II toxin-antitoxin system HicB family antitoxin [Rhodanobacteraceae bacterium]|nr:type II toxin-antitoxin system HicB family antitoxin [Rhodanobacteraceae bacterium]
MRDYTLHVAQVQRPCYPHFMDFTLQSEQEADGRWLAEVPEIPGVLAYGATADEAMAKAETLALRVLAERLENGEARPQAIRFLLAAA